MVEYVKQKIQDCERNSFGSTALGLCREEEEGEGSSDEMQRSCSGGWIFSLLWMDTLLWYCDRL